MHGPEECLRLVHGGYSPHLRYLKTTSKKGFCNTLKSQGVLCKDKWLEVWLKQMGFTRTLATSDRR